MKEYKQKEQKLNQGISRYLVSQYGHNGDLPPKGKPRDLIVQIKKKAHAKITDGQSGKRKEQEDAGGKPFLTKKEIQMSIDDMKYMSSG